MTPRSPLLLAQEYMLCAEDAYRRFGDSMNARRCRAIRIAIRNLLEDRNLLERESSKVSNVIEISPAMRKKHSG